MSDSGGAAVTKRLGEIRGGAPAQVPSVRVLAAFSQNTGCQLAALGFAAGVDFNQLLKGTRFRPSFGQSPFAIQRGLSFERGLRENNYASALSLFRGPLGLPAGSGAVVNLRDGFASGSGRSAARAAATLAELRRIVDRVPGAPRLVDGAVLAGTVGGRTAHFEADILTACEPDGLIRVAEVKSFPKVDDRVDPEQLGAALDQIAVYVLLARDAVRTIGADPERVSDRGLLVTPHNVGLTPTLSEACVGPRVARIRRVFAALPNATEVAASTPAGLSFGPISDTTAEEEKRVDALHRIADRVGTAYTPNCLATCGNARFCRARAITAGAPCATGTAAGRLLPEVLDLGRAESLTRGARPSPPEAPAAALLASAGRLIDEAASAPIPTRRTA